MLRLHHLLVFVDEQLPFRLLVVLQELTVKPGTFINTRENWIYNASCCVDLVDGSLKAILLGSTAGPLQRVLVLVDSGRMLDEYHGNVIKFSQDKTKARTLIHPVSTEFIKIRCVLARSSADVRVNIFKAAFAMFVCGCLSVCNVPTQMLVFFSLFEYNAALSLCSTPSTHLVSIKLPRRNKEFN
jgi:hypothetical protein